MRILFRAKRGEIFLPFRAKRGENFFESLIISCKSSREARRKFFFAKTRNRNGAQKVSILYYVSYIRVHFFGFGQNFRKSRGTKPIPAVGWRLEERRSGRSGRSGTGHKSNNPTQMGGEQTNERTNKRTKSKRR